MSSRTIRIGAIVIFATLFAVQVWRQNPATGLGPCFAGQVGLPATGVPENNTNGTVPGDPTTALKQGHMLFRTIGQYRSLHPGSYPDAAVDFLNDLSINPHAYGFEDGMSAIMSLGNPDNIYADNPSMRLSTMNNSWIICPPRPDGTAIGGPKEAGTRDVLAFSDLYYHQEIRHFDGTKDTIQQVGFFIVVWDDGQIEVLSYDKVLFARLPGTNSFYYAFPGQSGLPIGAKSYDEFWKTPRQ